MSGSKIFSKIDLKEAYQQLELNKNSRSITYFHTKNGIYHLKRLCYGINNSFEKFGKAITCKLGVMSNVKFIFDDIIICNESLNEHLKTLELLLPKICDLNLKINKAKCTFGQKKYLFSKLRLSKVG